MYTKITLCNYDTLHIFKAWNLTHRDAYITTLKLIQQNLIPYGCNEVKLMQVEHTEENHTLLKLLADGQHIYHVIITTYED